MRNGGKPHSPRFAFSGHRIPLQDSPCSALTFSQQPINFTSVNANLSGGQPNMAQAAITAPCPYPLIGNAETFGSFGSSQKQRA
jgi:hypothetical protein